MAKSAKTQAKATAKKSAKAVGSVFAEALGAAAATAAGVCTENLNPDVVVMKSAKDRV